MKLAAIDLDGTLLGSDHALSERNLIAVKRVAGSGAFVVLASGRQWHTIVKFAEQIGLPPSSPIIAYNGAMIRTVGDETVYHQPVPADAAKQIVRNCAAGGYHLNYYLNDVLHVRKETHWARLYEKRTGTTAVVGDLLRFDGQRPTKLLLIDTPETTDRLLKHYQEKYGKALYITKTDDEYLEFMNPAVSKGVALAEAASRLKVSADGCAAFGDSFNDLPMLEWAGVGVAMENAKPALKAIADLIAPANTADGVAVILKRLFPVHPQDK